MFKDAFLGGFLAGLINNKGRDVSEWAEKVRVLPAEGSPEPGKWKNSRTPYAVEIMKALSITSDTKKIVMMKGTQVCGTEIILNFHGYVMNWQPATMMVMMPTIKVCNRFSKQRLQPMIDCTPELKRIINDNRSQDSGNTILTKEYPGGYMFMVGSNSSSDARSTPAGYVTADEIDLYPADMSGEGDWLALIDKRMSNFRNSKILLVGSPTVKDISRIEEEFENGDKCYYYVPCVECGHMQVIKWGNFKYDKNDSSTIKLKCEKCPALMSEDDKPYLFANGEWRSTAKPKEKRTRSFHLSALYSAYGWRSWEECLDEYLKAIDSPIKMKTFVNTILGETYEETAKAVSWEVVKSREEVYECQVPRGVLFLTAGADVQGDRLECSVIGWGKCEESWHIEHGVFYGDPGQQDVWDQLDMFLKKTYNGVDGIRFKIASVCLDTAGGYEKQAYEFVSKREHRRIHGVKGASKPGAALINAPTRKSKVTKIRLISVGTFTAKNTIYSYLNVSKKGSCFCHYPKGLTDEFYKQLTAEKIRTKYINGKPFQEWHKTYQRNEALDCFVYSYVALVLLSPNYEVLYQNLYGENKEKKKEKAKKVRTTGKFKRKQGL